MNLKHLFGWSLGLLVLLYVLWQQDYLLLWQTLQQAGWALLLVLLLEPLLWLSQAAAWQLLFAHAQQARFADTYYASASASAINNLLPVFAIGGDLVKARHLVKRGVSGSAATAAGMVDLSLHAVSALGWSLIGLAMLAQITTDQELLLASVIGCVVLAAVILAFIIAQMLGSQRLANGLQRRFRQRGWNVLASDTHKAQLELRQLWRQPGTLLLSVLLRMAGRALMVPEIMFIGWLSGTPVKATEAAMITGLVILVKTVSFVVPARIGIQEGTFVAAGKLLSISAEPMFAIAIAIRLRETLASAPILLHWYVQEWRRARAEENMAVSASNP